MRTFYDSAYSQRAKQHISPSTKSLHLAAHYKRNKLTECESAHDCAVMINSLRRLQERAAFANDAERLINTSHISITVVSNCYDLLIHWFSESDKRFKMSCWTSRILNTELACLEHLTKIRNLQVYTMG